MEIKRRFLPNKKFEFLDGNILNNLLNKDDVNNKINLFKLGNKIPKYLLGGLSKLSKAALNWNPEVYFKAAGILNHTPLLALKLMANIPRLLYLELELLKSGLLAIKDGLIIVPNSTISPYELVMRKLAAAKGYSDTPLYTGVNKFFREDFENNASNFDVWTFINNPNASEEYAFLIKGGTNALKMIPQLEEALKELNPNSDDWFLNNFELLAIKKDPLNGGHIYSVTHPENISIFYLPGDGQVWGKLNKYTWQSPDYLHIRNSLENAQRKLADNKNGSEDYKKQLQKQLILKYTNLLADNRPVYRETGNTWSSDEVVDYARKNGYQGVFIDNIYDTHNHELNNERIILKGTPTKIVFGNTGDFDITNLNPLYGLVGLGIIAPDNFKLRYKKGSKIYIKPENRGKFTATKKRLGKTTEELTHSKNPLTRKRAIFALNAKKWAKNKS